MLKFIVGVMVGAGLMIAGLGLADSAKVAPVEPFKRMLIDQFQWDFLEAKLLHLERVCQK